MVEMKEVSSKIAKKSAIRSAPTTSAHVANDLIDSINKRVWDLINDRVWFGIHDVVRGHTSVSIPPDLVIIKTNRPQ